MRITRRVGRLRPPAEGGPGDAAAGAGARRGDPLRPPLRSAGMLLSLALLVVVWTSPTAAQTLNCTRLDAHCTSCTAERVGLVTQTFCTACTSAAYLVSSDRRACDCAPGFYFAGGVCASCGTGFW